MVQYGIYFYLTGLPLSCLFLFRIRLHVYKLQNNLQNLLTAIVTCLGRLYALDFGYSMPCWCGATGCRHMSAVYRLVFWWVSHCSLSVPPRAYGSPTGPSSARLSVAGLSSGSLSRHSSNNCRVGGLIRWMGPYRPISEWGCQLHRCVVAIRRSVTASLRTNPCWCDRVSPGCK